MGKTQGSNNFAHKCIFGAIRDSAVLRIADQFFAILVSFDQQKRLLLDSGTRTVWNIYYLMTMVVLTGRWEVRQVPSSTKADWQQMQLQSSFHIYWYSSYELWPNFIKTWHIQISHTLVLGSEGQVSSQDKLRDITSSQDIIRPLKFLVQLKKKKNCKNYQIYALATK